MRALFSGHLIKDPERKFASSGKVYAKAMVRVPAKQRSEVDPDSQLIFVTAFGDVAEALLALKHGDAVGVAGALEVRAAVYKDLPVANCNVIADKLLDIKRPPRPERRDAPSTVAPPAGYRRADAGDIASMDNDVPFG